jgi:hypothetical protein
MSQTISYDAAAIYEATGFLAGVCDFALTDDGRGFNASDTHFGHMLASTPLPLWTPDHVVAAWDMLRKYKAQLAGMGVEYDEIPLPPGAQELLDERAAGRRDRAAEARETVRKTTKQRRADETRATKNYVICPGEGEPVILAFDPNSLGQDFWQMVDDSKAIPGRAYKPEYEGHRKINLYPFTSLPLVVEFADTYQIPVTPDVRALVEIAKAADDEQTAAPGTRSPLFLDGEVYLDTKGRLTIKTEYVRGVTPQMNDALRALNFGRSTWIKEDRVHRPPLREPAKLMAVITRHELRLTDDARALIEAGIKTQELNTAEGRAITAEPVDVPGLADDITIMPQQFPPIRYALRNRRVFLGDEMGWGKTLQALATVAADGAYPAIVVCRPSLTINWVKEIGRFFPALTVFEANGTTPAPVPAGTDIVVIGTAALGALDKTRSNRAYKVFPWVDQLAALKAKALILDEGQDAKEQTANRTQAVITLAQPIIKRDGIVLDLTGTAIINRPKELMTQLQILGRISEFGGPGTFLVRYCEDPEKGNQWGRNFTGAKNLLELNDRLLRYGVMVRRNDDAALGLPSNTRHTITVPVAELDRAAMAEYWEAEADVITWLAEQARELARKNNSCPDSAAVCAAMKAMAAEHLVRLNALRQIIARAKMPAATRFIDGHLDDGEKVMIAVHHRDVVKAFTGRYGDRKIWGGQSVASKEEDKAAYQGDPNTKVITVAISAGGVGHTLTAGRIGVQVEMPWTPGDANQMMKRQHRIGQTRECHYYVLLAEGTVDVDMHTLVTGKQNILNQVLDGKADTGATDDERSIVAEVAWKLTQKGLAA